MATHSHIYRPHLFVMFPYVLFGGFLTLPSVFAIGESIWGFIFRPSFPEFFHIAIATCFTSPFLIMGAWVMLSWLTMRLVISQDGIEYRDFGYSIYADWSDVEVISTDVMEMVMSRMITFGTADKLRLRRSTLIASGLAKVFVKLMRWQWSIPIGWFALNWRNSKLGAEIFKYAPHI